MTRSSVTLLAVLTLGSSSACDKPIPVSDEVKITVSASQDLSPFGRTPPNGSTAYARDLVHLAPGDHRVEQRGPRELALVMVPTPPDMVLYCNSLYITGSTRISPEGDRCVIEFASPRQKESFLAREPRPEVGPYRLRGERVTDQPGDTSRKYIELENAGDKSDLADVIRIEQMDVDEEWKELYAGRVDVVPMTPIVNLQNFENMASVQTFILPIDSDMALYFNTAKEPWSRIEVRRHIAAQIDSTAIADVACDGHPSCVLAEPPFKPLDAPPAISGPIAILALASESGNVRAAQAVAFHLNDSLDCHAEVRAVTVTEFNAALVSGDHDLVVLPLAHLDIPDKRASIAGFLSSTAHYENPKLREAIRNGDPAAIEAILRDDVPVMRLYVNVQFAAIDNHLCVRWKPDSQSSWRWLGYLYPCKAQDAP